jgi:hypothetical protein
VPHMDICVLHMDICFCVPCMAHSSHGPSGRVSALNLYKGGGGVEPARRESDWVEPARRESDWSLIESVCVCVRACVRVCVCVCLSVCLSVSDGTGIRAANSS